MKSFILKPRFSETDAIGHINNTAIAVWFETARIDFLEEIVSAMGADAPTWFMASQTIDYLGENFFGTDTRQDLAVIKIGNSSFTVGCKMYQNDKQTVRCSAVLVHMDKASRRPAPLPAEARELLERELEADWL